MQWMNSKMRYGLGPQALHWLTALCVVVAWPLGQFMEAIPKGAPRHFAFWTHMTLGQCVILLLVARLLWRFANTPPALEPTRFGRLSTIAAKLSHFLLYALLVIVPFAGIIVQLKRGHALPLLGLWDIASPWPADRAVARFVLSMHYYLADALLSLAGVHAVAALVHHYALRDRTLTRMLPGAA